MKHIFFTLILSLSTVFTVWYGFNHNSELKKNHTETPPTLLSATLLTPAKTIADFSLTTTDGHPFTHHSLLGHWTLLFFGYAQCPDICPRTMVTVAEIWKQMPAALLQTQTLRFVFVSLDPESDTVQSLGAFLKRFHPSFIGLTGAESVIQRLGKSCGIYSWEDPNANTEGGPKIIDHSATLLLINPQGRIQALFSPPHQTEAIAKDLQFLLERRPKDMHKVIHSSD